MKNKHPKLEAARKIDPAEIKRGISPFFCRAWLNRKASKHEKEKKRAGRSVGSLKIKKVIK